MPRYFFNLYNDITALDEEGREFPDLAAAEAQGMQDARDMAAHSASKGKVDLHHRVEITDEAGALVKTIEFGEAVKIIS